MRPALTALALLLLAAPAAGLEPRLVKDINPVPFPAGSGPVAFTALGRTAVFEASDGSDRVLWTSDGTAEGTRVLVDACPGCTDAVEPLARIREPGGERLFFLAYAEPGRKSLWVTDGRAARRLSGPLSAQREAAWVAAQGVLYFTADGGLWRTDGTPEGTRQALAAPALQLTAFLGRVWFVSGRSLWRSDGTPGGTVLVRELSRKPRILGGLGRRLLFAAGGELWSTDGVLARDLQVLDAIVHGGRLWMIAETKRGQELWVSDGVSARALTGFARRRAFFDPDAAMHLGLPRSLPQVSAGDRLVFAAHDGVHGPEPWVSDGTPGGTGLVRDLCPGPCAGVETLGPVHRGRLYFAGTNGALGRELWMTDGSRVDLVRDACPGPCDGDPGSLIALGERVLFAADDGVNGTELWSSEGRLTDFEPQVPWASLHGAALPGMLLFGADDGEHGLELWATDGTSARLVRDLDASDHGGSFPAGLSALGETALFFADDGVHGYELWKSDGTAAGTVPVAELVPGEGPRGPPEVAAAAAAGGVLYLSLDGALWRTDGTAAGTRKMGDLGARRLQAFEGDLYVAAAGGLWRSDGTVLDRVTGPSHPYLLAVHAGRLWLLDDAGLWSSDGTGPGTRLRVDRLGGSLLASVGDALIVSNPEGLWATDGTATRRIGPAAEPAGAWNVFQGRLFYSAFSGGLWTTDGTPEGTSPLRPDMAPVAAFAALGDRLLFITRLPGAPLWETDGTAGGTLRVGDLAPGWIGRWELLAAGPRVFFLAFDPRTGVELWAIEGEP